MSMHPTRNMFREFKGGCTVWIETGTYKGDAITLAQQAGFLTMHTIDIVKQEEMNYKYDGVSDFRRHFGDSAEVLDKLLPELTKRHPGERFMYWLDAHSFLMDGDEDNFPLMRELSAILEHRKGHGDTILIDDFMMVSHQDITGLSYWKINEALYQINHDYKIELLPNPIKNNILVAYPVGLPGSMPMDYYK